MKLNRLSKVAIGVAAACGLYSAAGFWGLPAAVKWAASGPVSEMLGRSVTADEVKFNPWTLEFEASGIAMKDASGKEDQFSLGRIYTNMAGVASLTRFGLVLDQLTVDKLNGSLTLDDNGRLDIQDILDRFPADPEKEESGDPFRFSVNNITVSDSSFHFQAPSHHVDENLTDISLAIPFIGSIGSDREINVTPELTFKDNGTPFEAHGRTLPFKDTMATQLHISIDRYSLQHLGAMLPIAADITSGDLSLAADITFAQGLNGAQNTLLIQGEVTADQFAMQPKNGTASENSIAFEKLSVKTGDIDVFGQKAEIADVSLVSPKISASRLADGNLPWLKAFETAEAKKEVREAAAKAEEIEKKEDGKKPEEKNAASENSGSGSVFRWVVRNASLSDGSLAFTDHAAKDTRITAENLQFSTTNLTLEAGETTPFSLEAQTLGGALKATGSAELATLSGQASVSAQKLLLESVSAYAEEAGVRLNGTASASVSADFDFRDTDKPSVKARGGLELDRANADIAGDSPLHFGTESLRAKDFSVSYTGDAQVSVASLLLSGTALSLPESAFDLKLAKTDASGTALSWKNAPGVLDVAFGKLSLGTPEITAGAFRGGADELGGTELKVGWNGTSEEVSFSGAAFGGKNTRLNADPFRAELSDHLADNLKVLWKGKDLSLAVTAPSVSLSGSKFDVQPASGEAEKVSAKELNVALELGEAQKTSVKASEVSTAGASVAVAGDSPVNASLSDFMTRDNEILIENGETSVSSGSVHAAGVKSRLDIFDINTETADVGTFSLKTGSALQTSFDSAALTKLQVIAPVNAARVSALSDSVNASSFSYAEGASGGLSLQSAEVNTTAFEIAGGKNSFGRVAKVAVASLSAPNTGTVRADSILIDSPRASVSRLADGSLDIDPLLGKRESAEAAKETREAVKKKVQAAEKKTGTEPSRPVRIGEFRVTDGGLTFRDSVITPQGVIRFQKFNTSVKPVVIGGNDNNSVLSVSGILNGAARLSIQGTGSPFADKGKLTAKGSVKAISMPFFSPYTLHYVSYPIQKGNLTITSDITMTDKTYLNAENHLLIEQLGWGEYQPNDTSTSLPVTLATSLLTDSKGNLDFDLPISGDLADPEFSFGSLILTGLKNLIVKVVASPVNLLGSIATLGGAIGGSSDAGSAFVPYLSGEGRMTGDQRKSMLPQITEALAKDPKMKVEITSVASEQGDNTALHQRTYSNLLKLVQSTMPENERSREAAVNALYAQQYPDDKSSLTLQQKEAKLYKDVQPDASNLAELADRRSRSLSKALTEAGVPSERIFITAPEIDKKSVLGGVKLKFIKG